MAKAESCCADFVQRNAADLLGQTYHPANLVFDPSHTFFVCSHIRGKNVFLDIPYSLTTAMGQTCCGIFHGHCPRQAEALLGTDIWCHAYPADRRSCSHVVDDQNSFKIDPGFIDMNDLGWPEFIVEFVDVFHEAILSWTMANDLWLALENHKDTYKISDKRNFSINHEKYTHIRRC